MKIIDLLNKIANREEVPKKIKYEYKKFEFIGGAYEDEKGNDLCYYDDSCMRFLNDEVEILEEENKIPEKLEEFGLIQYNLDYIDYKNIEILKEWLNKDFQTIYDTLDLIIKNQNKLIDYLESKGDE